MIKITHVLTGDPIWIQKSQIAEFFGSGLRNTQTTDIRMVGQDGFRTFEISPYELASVLD